MRDCKFSIEFIVLASPVIDSMNSYTMYIKHKTEHVLNIQISSKCFLLSLKRTWHNHVLLTTKSSVHIFTQCVIFVLGW